MTYLAPVNFQEMRVAKAAPAPVEEPVAGADAGLPLFTRPLVDRRLVESIIHRPYAHHQAENLFTATQDIVGPQWGAMPAHIAKSLKAINED